MHNDIQQYARAVLALVRDVNAWRDEYDPGTAEWLTLCALAEAAEQLALSVADQPLRPESADQQDSLRARTATLDALFTAFSTRTLRMGEIACASCGTGSFHARSENTFTCGTCGNTLDAQELDVDSSEAWAVDTDGTLGKVSNPMLAHHSMTAALSTWLMTTERYVERQALVEFHRSALDLRTALSVGIPFPTRS
jgi:ribosomal protein S27AE